MFLHQEGSLGNLVEQQGVVDLPCLQFRFVCTSRPYIVIVNLKEEPMDVSAILHVIVLLKCVKLPNTPLWNQPTTISRYTFFFFWHQQFLILTYNQVRKNK